MDGTPIRGGVGTGAMGRLDGACRISVEALGGCEVETGSDSVEPQQPFRRVSAGFSRRGSSWSSKMDIQID